ncbi:hypothetical protein HMPREF0731_4572, partial [Pseudoroseomonas cervicalis ATCC 49957]
AARPARLAGGPGAARRRLSRPGAVPRLAGRGGVPAARLHHPRGAAAGRRLTRPPPCAAAKTISLAKNTGSLYPQSNAPAKFSRMRRRPGAAARRVSRAPAEGRRDHAGQHQGGAPP